MKKTIISWFKSVEKKNKVQLITELLTLECSIAESVDMYNLVKANYKQALSEKQKQMALDFELINKTL